MKTRLLKIRISILLAILILLPVCTQAGFTDITQDTNIYSGSYDAIRVFEPANLNFYGDSVGLLDFQDNSTGSFYGGTAWEIDVASSAIINLYGGQIHHMYSHNIVHIFGQNITIEPYYTDDLYVQGLWGDGTPFDFIAFRAVPYNSQFIVHEIPEPCTFGFAGFGFLILRRIIKTFRK